MDSFRSTAFLFALASTLALGGCGKDEPKAPAGGAGAGAHSHTAPHGGEVLELGDDEAHLEMMHDHDGGNVAVYAYGKTFDKVVPVTKPTITIQMQDGSMAEVPLTPIEPKGDGTAEGWKGQHAGLISDPWNGRIKVRIGGKDYQSPLEGPGHAHK